MKTSIKSIAAVIALTAFVAGPASAVVSQGDLNRDIHSAVGGSSNVFVNVDNGVVTLSGYFADTSEKNAALQIALNGTGVERVINNATVSN